MRRERARPFRMSLARSGLATVALTCLIVGGAIAAESGSRPEQESKSQQVFATVCGRCHPVERITAVRRTRKQWEENIDSMITARGAQVSDEEFDIILSYLTKEYGRVDINRAPAEEIVEVVRIADEMAAAIVAYRKQHGPFEDFDALLKVPGIDREALEKHRDAISF